MIHDIKTRKTHFTNFIMEVIFVISLLVNTTQDKYRVPVEIDEDQDWENQDPDNQNLKNVEISENFYKSFCEIKL